MAPSSRKRFYCRQRLLLGLVAAVLMSTGSPRKRRLREERCRRLKQLRGGGEVEMEETGLSGDRKARKDLQKKQKEAEKLAKKFQKEKRQEEQSKSEERLRRRLSILRVNSENATHGTYNMIQSEGRTYRTFTPIANVRPLDSESNAEGAKGSIPVWIRARVHRIRSAGKLCFLVLRSGFSTVQAVVEGNEDPQLLKFVQKSLVPESIIDILAYPAQANVTSCTQKDVELQVKRLFVVNNPKKDLAFQVDDSQRAENEEGVRVMRDLRLDNRVLDLRAPRHAAIMSVQSALVDAWRQALRERGFTEIHTPKLIKGASEGGSEVFKTDYFGTVACLAQSPQLFKQMAIAGDMRRVYEIAPVFRAESSHTQRHLCEFIGLDVEMEIFEHYEEVVDVLEELLVSTFDRVSKSHPMQLESIRKRFAKEDGMEMPPVEYLRAGKNPRLRFPEAISLLQKEGIDIGTFDDLSTEHEILLGNIVKRKYGTDLFVLLGYPKQIRPFYTMEDPNDDRYTCSFDIFLRGQEIASGAQRVHEPELLRKRLKEANVSEASLKDYVASFEWGTPPHGGAGFGMERLVMLFTGAGNIRECCMFPRDPKRLAP